MAEYDDDAHWHEPVETIAERIAPMFARHGWLYSDRDDHTHYLPGALVLAAKLADLVEDFQGDSLSIESGRILLRHIEDDTSVSVYLLVGHV